MKFACLFLSNIFYIANAFVASSIDPSVKDFMQQSVGVSLNIQLLVGTNEQEPKLSLSGLNVEFLEESAPENHPSLPGANGPRSHLSGGVRALKIVQQPSFIDVNGIQEVTLENACWEIIKRKGATAGIIVCGFQSPNQVKRNKNSPELPAGRIYLTIPLWTKEDLKRAQEKKIERQIEAREILKEKAAALDSLAREKNLLKKALHFRNAVNAQEKLYYHGNSDKWVPDATDSYQISEDLVVATKGTLWRKDSMIFGPDHSLIGAIEIVDMNQDRPKLHP